MNEEVVQEEVATEEVDAQTSTEGAEVEVEETAEEKFHTIKIDGEERQVSEAKIKEMFGLEELNEKQLAAAIKTIQKEYASDKRMRSAAMIQKEANEFANFAKTNPEGFLEFLGIDVQKFILERAHEILQEDDLPEAEKKARRLEKENLTYKEKELLRQQQEREEKEQKEAQQEAIAIKQEIKSAAEKFGMPFNQTTSNLFRDYMLEAVNQGYYVTAEDVAPYVLKEWDSSVQSYVEKLPPDKLPAKLGEKNLGKIRQSDVGRIKQPVTTPAGTQAQKPAAKTKVKSSDAWDEIFSKFY